jgi:hypothetical protein
MLHLQFLNRSFTEAPILLQTNDFSHKHIFFCFRSVSRKANSTIRWAGPNTHHPYKRLEFTVSAVIGRHSRLCLGNRQAGVTVTESGVKWLMFVRCISRTSTHKTGSLTDWSNAYLHLQVVFCNRQDLGLIVATRGQFPDTGCVSVASQAAEGHGISCVRWLTFCCNSCIPGWWGQTEQL